MKKITNLFIYACLSICNAQEIEIETFATGLTGPVNIKHAGDNRLYIAEIDGFIQIVDENGSLNPTPFLDIDDRVINFGGEQGLLGLAFHPDYETNGYFFVNYIDNNQNTVISRFTRSSLNLADSNSELILLTITQPFSNHNGGDMAFGTDGYLYISTGDGGSGGDPGNRAQNLNLLLGKMLRIDVNVSQVDADAGVKYYIPANNPFVGNPSALDEIWAYGLRNPWKFSFDKQTNDLWIADVGQSTREEINMTLSTSAGGENYGWKCFEGTYMFSTETNCSTITHHEPIAEYDYGGTPFRCAITGGYVYRGNAQPSLQGLYFFADYCSDEIGILQYNNPNWEMTFTDPFSGRAWTTFGESTNGEIYVADSNSGTLFRIIDASLSVTENELFNIKMYPNPVTDILTFDYTNSNLLPKVINIFDIQGKLMKSITNFEADLTTISTRNLTNGFYIVELTGSNGQKKTNKLIIN